MIKVICENGELKEAALKGFSIEEVLDFINGTADLLNALADTLFEDKEIELEFKEKLAGAFALCLSDHSPSFIDDVKSKYLSLLEDYKRK